MIVSRVPSNQQFPNSRFNIALLTVPEAHVEYELGSIKTMQIIQMIWDHNKGMYFSQKIF